MENSLIRPDPGELLTGRKIEDVLNFYGLVKDSDASAVAGAAVLVFACFAGGIEKTLSSTFTDREGVYFICAPKLPDYSGLLGFKVRAGKAYILSEGADSPGIFEAHLHEEATEAVDEALEATDGALEATDGALEAADGALEAVDEAMTNKQLVEEVADDTVIEEALGLIEEDALDVVVEALEEALKEVLENTVLEETALEETVLEATALGKEVVIAGETGDSPAERHADVSVFENETVTGAASEGAAATGTNPAALNDSISNTGLENCREMAQSSHRRQQLSFQWRFFPCRTQQQSNSWTLFPYRRWGNNNLFRFSPFGRGKQVQSAKPKDK